MPGSSQRGARIGRAMMTLAAGLLCSAFGKGEKVPAEHRIFTAEESGLEVVQLTTHSADDAGLYFTGEAIVPELNALVIASRRTGSWNLFRMDLATFEMVQLTHSKRISGTGAVVAPGSREAFYRDGAEIKAVHLETLAERVVTRVPEGHSLSAALSVTADGRTVAFSISEIIPLATKTDVIYSDMDERFDKRPWSAVLLGGADGGGWRELARQKKWISHTLIDPRDPALVLYCHEGHWQRVEQRMWLVDAATGQSRPLRPEETPDLRIGHEYWFADGVRVGYHGRYPNKGPNFVGIADARTGAFVEYPLPGGEGHTHANEAGTLFIGDGSEKEPFLTLHRLVNGRLESTRLFRHGSSFSRQEWHPHPRFTPDGRGIVFTSSRAGNGDVYLIRLGRLADAR